MHVKVTSEPTHEDAILQFQPTKLQRLEQFRWLRAIGLRVRSRARRRLLGRRKERDFRGRSVDHTLMCKVLLVSLWDAVVGRMRGHDESSESTEAWGSWLKM